MKNASTGTALAACVLAVTAGSAYAGFSDILFTITATNDAGTATFAVDVGQATADGEGNFRWSTSDEIILRDAATNAEVARLKSAAFELIEDPVADVTFSVLAGATDTVFEIKSGLVAFPTLVNPEASASASVSVTDLTGDSATLTGLFGSGAAFSAQYNGVIPTGSVFADLIDSPVTAGFFGTNGDSADFPLPTGSAFIADSVNDINVGFNFTLSAGDLASGNGVFNVVPTPSAALLVLGGLAGITRRRR